MKIEPKFFSAICVTASDTVVSGPQVSGGALL